MPESSFPVLMIDGTFVDSSEVKNLTIISSLRYVGPADDFICLSIRVPSELDDAMKLAGECETLMDRFCADMGLKEDDYYVRCSFNDREVYTEFDTALVAREDKHGELFSYCVALFNLAAAIEGVYGASSTVRIEHQTQDENSITDADEPAGDPSADREDDSGEMSPDQDAFEADDIMTDDSGGDADEDRPSNAAGWLN